MTKVKEVWAKELPPRRPRTYDWFAITAELQANPGEWKLIARKAHISLAGAIKQKRMVALRSDEWEYITRTFGNNRQTNTCDELWMQANRKEG